ncbi:N6-adenosine-methyltransferase MT-A70 [Plasmodium brasilianum]|uniref:N6-adenosine-methyltransferase MT-A70 n=1 Tax=Plasmodium brasilianum TaxID=5824 RepID=A0ACB9YH18_PLABR|nr:N6-adenosine-methyltransferase MT-A70 [Plasmodium brasilianum]
MSLAREKYLKRKRELLENINIIDNNIGEKKEAILEKEKREKIKNEENNTYERKHDEANKFMSQKDSNKLKEDRKIEKEGKRVKKSGYDNINNNSNNNYNNNDNYNSNNNNKNNSSSSYNQLNYKKDYWHHDQYGNRDDHDEHMKRGKKDFEKILSNSKKDRNNNNEEETISTNSNVPVHDLPNINNPNKNVGKNYSNINKNANSSSSIGCSMATQDIDRNKNSDRKKNNSWVNNSSTTNNNNMYEILTDLNNIDICNSAILLIYTCKLLLHMCGKENENQNVTNTSLTSVEILREIKNRNRKNVKLLKINILNNILIYLSYKNTVRGEDKTIINSNELNQEKLDNTFEKHKEIKLEDTCIDIENVGINIIIKVIYIKNIKHLLLRYIHQFTNNNYKNVGEATNLSNAKSGDKVKNEGKKMVGIRTPNEYKNNSNLMEGGNNNTYNSVLQENEKKKKKVNNTNCSGEYDTKYKEENRNSNNNNSSNNKISYLENLLNEPTAKEKKIKQEKTSILSIIEAPTVIEEMRIKKFQKKDDSVKIICPYLTKKNCQKHSTECNKVHFKKIISEHTDVSLGDCSYLDTCRHIETCKFVHYAVDKDDQVVRNQENVNENKVDIYNVNDNTYGPQWIRCDLRNFDLSIFNQYVSVVMADPPWDIHMDLPYGTMTDNEMKRLPVQLIQDEGMIFLWVTGRAMELARECLQIWGYTRVEEILWVKTNHLQRIIRTGRTGHWLNHSKEHCLVGIKGHPVINRNIDCNVIVSEVRETSRKPDEIYSLIERLCPQNLKIELFGRPHNVRNNWITLGNQLNGVVLHHPQIKERYNKIASQFNMPLCED